MATRGVPVRLVVWLFHLALPLLGLWLLLAVPSTDLLVMADALRADLTVLSVTTSERAAAAGRLAGRLRSTGVPTLVGRPGATVAELVESARSVTAHR